MTSIKRRELIFLILFIAEFMCTKNKGRFGFF